MNNQGPIFSARPVLRIDLGAIKDNYRAIKDKVGSKVQVAASVKADAYGLGAERVSRALYGAGCRVFFVATAGEGKGVRTAVGDNASIYVLNGPAPRDLSLIFGSDLKPVINSLTQARIWGDAIKSVNSPPFSAIHIDTGINRLGFPADEFEKFCKNKNLQEALMFDHVMSHLACAPDKDDPYNEVQLKAFQRSAARLPLKPLSLANTAGVYLGKSYHFNMVRPGIGLYGGCATNTPKQENVKPVVSLMAPVLQIRTLKAGDRVGYNSLFTAGKDMTIAVVGAGYADGIPVSSSSEGETFSGFATVQSRRVPIIGRVSMDLTVLDISELNKVPRIGDWAEFLGSNFEKDAKDASLLNYERLISLSTRAKREYK